MIYIQVTNCSGLLLTIVDHIDIWTAKVFSLLKISKKYLWHIIGKK